MSRASLNHQTAMRNVATNHPPSPPRPPSPPPPSPHPSHPHQPGGSSRAHRGAPHVWRALPRLIHCAQRRPASGGAHVLRAAGGGAGGGRQGAGTHRRAHRRGRRRRQTPQGETGGRAQGCCGRQVKGLSSRLPVGAASITPSPPASVPALPPPALPLCRHSSPDATRPSPQQIHFSTGPSHPLPLVHMPPILSGARLGFVRVCRALLLLGKIASVRARGGGLKGVGVLKRGERRPRIGRKAGETKGCTSSREFTALYPLLEHAFGRADPFQDKRRPGRWWTARLFFWARAWV